jgi:hypothetical protein
MLDGFRGAMEVYGRDYARSAEFAQGSIHLLMCSARRKQPSTAGRSQPGTISSDMEVVVCLAGNISFLRTSRRE